MKDYSDNAETRRAVLRQMPTIPQRAPGAAIASPTMAIMTPRHTSVSGQFCVQTADHCTTLHSQKMDDHPA
jgi:hypothetical protein